MVEPVADLLQGRGHPVVRVRDAGLAADDDSAVAEYSLSKGLIVVTFDPDFKRSLIRQSARCLYIRTPERTATERLRDRYGAVIALLWGGAALVTLPRQGAPF